MNITSCNFVLHERLCSYNLRRHFSLWFVLCFLLQAAYLFALLVVGLFFSPSSPLGRTHPHPAACPTSPLQANKRHIGALHTLSINCLVNFSRVGSLPPSAGINLRLWCFALAHLRTFADIDDRRAGSSQAVTPRGLAADWTPA